MSTFGKEFESVKSSLDSLASRVEKMEEKIETTRKRQSKLEEEIEEVKQLQVSMLKDLPEEIIGEIERRVARKKNLIIKGFPEAEEGSVNERRAFDEKNLQELLDYLELSDVEVGNIFRVGKPRSDGKRLLKFSTTTQENKRKILKRASYLRTSDSYKSVFLGADLTPVQQEKDRLLRTELKERRERGEDVVIYKGKVQDRRKTQHF